MSGPGPLAWKRVDGWACDCAGADWHAEPAQYCPRRYRSGEYVPTYPQWRMPAGLSATGRSDATEDAGGVRGAGVEVPCRPVAAGDDVPSAARRLAGRLHRLGVETRLTYARGTGRRLTVVGHEPEEDGGGKIRAFVDWPIESVALRTDVLALAWTRPVEAGAWKPDGGYAVWAERIRVVNVTQGTALVKWLEGRWKEGIRR